MRQRTEHDAGESALQAALPWIYTKRAARVGFVILAVFIAVTWVIVPVISVIWPSAAIR